MYGSFRLAFSPLFKSWQRGQHCLEGSKPNLLQMCPPTCDTCAWALLITSTILLLKLMLSLRAGDFWQNLLEKPGETGKPAVLKKHNSDHARRLAMSSSQHLLKTICQHFEFNLWGTKRPLSAEKIASYTRHQTHAVTGQRCFEKAPQTNLLSPCTHLSVPIKLALCSSHQRFLKYFSLGRWNKSRAIPLTRNRKFLCNRETTFLSFAMSLEKSASPVLQPGRGHTLSIGRWQVRPKV